MNSLAHDEQAIVAQCTPTGSGALALIRISGTNAWNIAQKISRLASKKNLTQLDSHTIHYGSVITNTGSAIDNVLFLLMRGPSTFTGEDTVEITCHNNPLIIERIIEQAILCGARLAQPGEFSKRAFLNNKIDLVQAEALNDLIHANTTEATKKALAQLNGNFSHWIASIEEHLMQALVHTQASFEFIDEEITFDHTIIQHITDISKTLAQLKKSYHNQQHIKEGLRIALIGSVNAGKSSLFNALLGKKRAIVTPIAGTTRDTVEAGMYQDGMHLTYIDTAGIRKTKNKIEQEGINRSFDEATKADIILLIWDGSQKLSEQEQELYLELIDTWQTKIIPVQTKCDIATKQDSIANNTILVSSEKQTNIAKLQEIITTKARNLIGSHDAPFMITKRQFHALTHLETNLEKISKQLSTSPIAYEILSYELELALQQLSELTGKTINTQVMDSIFNQFCVGK